MQTSQRRIPVGGDNGNFKTWKEMTSVYMQETESLRDNLQKLENHNSDDAQLDVAKAQNYAVKLITPFKTHALSKGEQLFEENRGEIIDAIAPEIDGMQAMILNRDTTRIVGTTIEFESADSVMMLVGFFNDDDPKFAAPPKLEVDATGNEYGQAEPVISNAINIKGMPIVNIHAYHLGAGRHVINLPKGIIMIAGFTQTQLKPRDAGLNGAGDEVDWLFMK
jgi:hypothetical protein